MVGNFVYDIDETIVVESVSLGLLMGIHDSCANVVKG